MGGVSRNVTTFMITVKKEIGEIKLDKENTYA